MSTDETTSRTQRAPSATAEAQRATTKGRAGATPKRQPDVDDDDRAERPLPGADRITEVWVREVSSRRRTA